MLSDWTRYCSNIDFRESQPAEGRTCDTGTSRGDVPNVCGRFTLTTTTEYLAEVLEIDSLELERGYASTQECGIQPRTFPAPRYNVAPGQDVITVQATEGASRIAQFRRWGLIPSWAEDAKVGYRMINARSETVAEKPAFRAAFRQRRCLIPADGFYEWEKKGRGAGAARQPYHIGLEGGGVFGMAGLWEAWVAKGGEGVESCTVLTTTANERIRFLHERMPVILPREHWDHWLDTGVHEPTVLLPLLAPYPADAMALRPVSPRVNDARVDDAECLAAYELPQLPEQGSLF